MLRKKDNIDEKNKKKELNEAKKLLNRFKRKHSGNAIVKDYA